MSYGPIQVFTATMVSGGDTAVFSLPNAYSRAYFQLPSLSTNAELSVKGSTDGTDFYVVRHASSVAAPTAKVYASSVLNSIVPAEDCIMPFIKLTASAVVSGGGTFKMICVY